MSDATWKPSKGQWGIFGSDAGSKEGQRRRGKAFSSEAQTITKESDKQLALLLSQFKRSSGPDSVYAKQMELEQAEARVTGEGFLEEADRKAAALRDTTSANIRAQEKQTAQTGFAGAGSTGRARSDLARSIQEKGGDIYEDLTRQRVTQDLALEKKGLASETEQFRELDRIEMEAVSIASQTRQALQSMEDTKKSYSPNPSLDKFTWRPGDQAATPPAGGGGITGDFDFSDLDINIDMGTQFGGF